MMVQCPSETRSRSSASESGNFQSRGTVDLVLTHGYVMGAVIKNQMPDSLLVQGRQTQDQRVNVSVVSIKRATISYEFQEEPLAGALTAGFGGSTHDVFLSGSVGTAGGLTGLGIPLLTPAVAAEMDTALGDRTPETPFPRAGILVTVQIFGQTLDTSPVNSDPFIFPLDVCKGCLLEFPGDAVEGAGNPNCRNIDNVPPADLCLLGQDKPVDCRVCRLQKPIAQRNDCEPL